MTPELLLNRAGIQIWHADSEELLPILPTDIDLLITDPPFGKPFVSNRTDRAETIAGDDDQAKVDHILAGAWAKLRPHRHGYIFGPPRDLAAARAPLIWDRVYMASGNLANTWGASHVELWFYAHRYKSEPRAGELAAKLRRGSVIRVPAPRGKASSFHPNHKPPLLWQHLIEASSLPGDLVLDTFCGAGSSGVACALLGRRYIGGESDRIYAERAAKWVDQVIDWAEQIRG